METQTAFSCIRSLAALQALTEAAQGMDFRASIEESSVKKAKYVSHASYLIK